MQVDCYASALSFVEKPSRIFYHWQKDVHFIWESSPRNGRGRWPHTLKNPCFFDPMPKFKRTISGAPKKFDWQNQIAQHNNSNPGSQRSTPNDVLTHAEPSAHSSWLCSWDSQHAWHTHDSRHTGDSAARQRRCAHALPGCQGCPRPRGGHVSISGLKQKMLDHPSRTKPAPVRRLPSATLLSTCVKRVYDSPSAVLESALTR